jgi:hypothetical protein
MMPWAIAVVGVRRMRTTMGFVTRKSWVAQMKWPATTILQHLWTMVPVQIWMSSVNAVEAALKTWMQTGFVTMLTIVWGSTMNVANAMAQARWVAPTLAHAIMKWMRVATMEVAPSWTVVVFVVEMASVGAPTVWPAIMRQTLGATMAPVSTTTPLVFAMGTAEPTSTWMVCVTM